jgi:hypothetical protein
MTEAEKFSTFSQSDNTVFGKEALEKIINLIKDAKVSDDCIILMPEMGKYTIYKVPAKIAKTILRCEI